MGQSIDALKEKVLNFSKQQEAIAAKNASAHQALLIAHENLNANVHKLFTDLVDRIGKCENELLRVLAKLRQIDEEVSKNCIKKQQFEASLTKIDNLVVSNHLTHTLKNDNLNHSFKQLQGQTEENLKRLKTELTPKTPEIDPIKAQLDERFKVWKIDFDGLFKEIAVLKKTFSYDQKKFEHIYTLIERLKEGKQ